MENGGGSHVLSECEDFKQEQSRISRLERQAQDFLNAVFHRKGTTYVLFISHYSFTKFSLDVDIQSNLTWVCFRINSILFLYIIIEIFFFLS